MTHLYERGQVLEARASLSGLPAGPCQVTFCLPHDRGPFRYRIKPLNGGLERVVDEGDLSPSTASAPSATPISAPSLSISVKRR